MKKNKILNIFSTVLILLLLLSSLPLSPFAAHTATDGDGTVTLHSATIGGTTPSDRTFYQTGSSGGSADHNGMIDGKDNDYNTINFIVTIINNELEDFSASQLETEFGIETR